MAYDCKTTNYLENSDKAIINDNNPIYLDNGDFDYYFALSYEQDLENPMNQNEYQIKIIYNEEIVNDYSIMKMNIPFYFNTSNEIYRLEKHNDNNLVLTFIIYGNLSVGLTANIDNDINVNLESIKLNKRYIRKIINKEKINKRSEYQIELKGYNQILKDICVLFYYNFTNEEVKDNIENYNDIIPLKINQKDNKISWTHYQNVKMYEYI